MIIYERHGAPIANGGPLAIQRKVFAVRADANEDSIVAKPQDVQIRKEFPESWIYESIGGDDLE